MDTELEILKALEFKLYQKTLYDYANEELKRVTESYKFYFFTDEDIQCMETHINFLL